MRHQAPSPPWSCAQGGAGGKAAWLLRGMCRGQKHGLFSYKRGQSFLHKQFLFFIPTSWQIQQHFMGMKKNGPSLNKHKHFFLRFGTTSSKVFSWLIDQDVVHDKCCKTFYSFPPIDQTLESRRVADLRLEQVRESCAALNGIILSVLPGIQKKENLMKKTRKKPKLRRRRNCAAGVIEPGKI